jgi:hypothetical protein
MRVMKTDNAVDVWPDAALKNFIFYIFSMYEFSHSLGHSRPTHSAPVPNNVQNARSDHSRHSIVMLKGACGFRFLISRPL